MKESPLSTDFLIQFNLYKRSGLNINPQDFKRIAKFYNIDEFYCKTLIKKHEEVVNNLVASIKKEHNVLIDNIGSTYNKSIIFIGDSLTSDRESYLNMLRCMFQDYSNIRFIDSAISGDTTFDILKRLYDSVLNIDFDAAFILIGTNDAKIALEGTEHNLISLEEYKRNLKFIIKNIKNKGAKIFILTLPYVNAEKYRGYFKNKMDYSTEKIDQYNHVIKDVAQELNIGLVDIHQKLSGLKTKDYLLEDGIHLNNLGQTIICQSVLQALHKKDT
jgi:lysophospholipase L1-like esterase